MKIIYTDEYIMSEKGSIHKTTRRVKKSQLLFVRRRIFLSELVKGSEHFNGNFLCEMQYNRRKSERLIFSDWCVNYYWSH